MSCPGFFSVFFQGAVSFASPGGIGSESVFLCVSGIFVPLEGVILPGFLSRAWERIPAGFEADF